MIQHLLSSEGWSATPRLARFTCIWSSTLYPRDTRTHAHSPGHFHTRRQQYTRLFSHTHERAHRDASSQLNTAVPRGTTVLTRPDGCQNAHSGRSIRVTCDNSSATRACRARSSQSIASSATIPSRLAPQERRQSAKDIPSGTLPVVIAPPCGHIHRQMASGD